jgi:hypothetical protein
MPSEARRRSLVEPGLTGLWQVSDRSELQEDEGIRLDLRYVDNWSLMLDLHILWKTALLCYRDMEPTRSYAQLIDISPPRHRSRSRGRIEQCADDVDLAAVRRWKGLDLIVPGRGAATAPPGIDLGADLGRSGRR